jgi:two-component system response regulator QseB
MSLLFKVENVPEATDRRTDRYPLVVEDDADSREIIVRGLRRFGYEADCAGTFLEAVAKLTAKVDWLILDLCLPDGDGVALLRYIREHELPVRVAVVTGSEDGPLLAETMRLKPDAFFVKPVDLAEVATCMASGGRHCEGDDGFSVIQLPT